MEENEPRNMKDAGPIFREIYEDATKKRRGKAKALCLLPFGLPLRFSPIPDDRSEAFYSFDTNVFLDLYRYDATVVAKFFEFCDQGPTGLSFYVAEEYSRNRKHVLNRMKNRLTNDLDSFIKRQTEACLSASHSLDMPFKMMQEITDALAKLKNVLHSASTIHLQWIQDCIADLNKDPVFKGFERVFNRMPHAGFDKIEERLSGAQDRFQQGVGPGSGGSSDSYKIDPIYIYHIFRSCSNRCNRGERFRLCIRQSNLEIILGDGPG